MVLQHLVVIHLIDRVAGGNHHVGLMALLQPVQILINGIRGSSVPGAVRRCDGRGEDIQASLLSSEIPPLGGA